MRALFGILGLFTLVALTGMQPPEKKDDTKPAEAKKDDAKKDDAKKDEKKDAGPAKVKSILKVTVPTEKAELLIMNQPTKSTGTVREFESPDLEQGKPYEYDFVLKFAPNNYTTITRTLTAKFTAGEVLTVDLTKKKDDDKAVIRWVPTPDDIVGEMMKLGKVTKDDVVYDLGCGDGKIVIAAVKDAKAKKGVGVDIDAEKVKEAKAKVKEAKLDDKVEIRQGDALAITEKEVGDATVVMLYMSDELGELIKPKLLASLKVGTRVVSHRFKLGDWAPDKTVTITGEDGDQYTLHTWTVTADAKAGKKSEPKKDDKKPDEKKKEEPKKDDKKPDEAKKDDKKKEEPKKAEEKKPDVKKDETKKTEEKKDEKKKD